MSSEVFFDDFFMKKTLLGGAVIFSHDLFFIVGLGIILGTVLGGFGFSVLFVLLLGFILVFLSFYFRILRKVVLIFSIFLLLGAVYYTFDDFLYWTKKENIEFSGDFRGKVFDNPQLREDRQTVRIKVLGEGGGRILVYLRATPVVTYGDELLLSGDILRPPADSYGNYLAKERMHGVSFYPDAKILETGGGNFFFTSLYFVREKIKKSISNLFPQRQSAFLSGVLLGDRGEFSSSFLEKLSSSGTMHLTALSGLHMTIIVFLIFSVVSVLCFGKKRTAFFIVFFVVFLFVAMTGFKVSAIRASIMAFTAGLAKYLGRNYNPRNAIIFAGLFLTLLNPKAPVFDLGFQLSFSATLSIIYLVPVIRRLSFFNQDSFFGWRDILAITIGAQLGVAPLTIMYFENFSFTSLFANIAILVVMPFLMVSGIVVVLIYFVLPSFAVILSKPTFFLLDYSIFVVEFFYRFRLSFNPNLNWFLVVLYYLFLIFIIYRYRSESSL